MSNVSVILCVPHLIKNNCYSNIDTVTEPMQCNYATSMLVVNTNKFGAFKRVEEKNESQRVSVKIVDNNIYNVEFVDSIQQNQMIGDTPNYCIPLSINAITVQGISYSDPYFSSFNLNYKMAFGAPEYMNKSDYAFKSSVCIIRDEPYTDKTQLLNEKSAHNMKCKTKTRMITNDAKSIRTHHDNNVSDVTEPSKPQPAPPTFSNGDLTFDAMLELMRNEERIIKAMPNCEELDSWGVPRQLRLRGGGESSLNAATGWGSPPASNNAGNWGGNSSGQANNGSNNTQQQWNNTAQRPPTSQADMNSNKGNGNQMPPTSAASQNWQSSPPNMPNSPPNNNGAPANNGTNNAGNGNGGGSNPPNSAANTNGPNAANGNNGNNTNSASSAKIEQLNSMREALFSQDGWGGQHVNQDTNWDVPGSPEPGSKVEPTAAGGPPPWKPNVNNGAFLGTDLWEANLRNGGQPPPQPAAKTPWGHTPTTNIGGTWGEDDDAADSTNVWTGPPPPQQWPAGPPQHAQQWTAPKKDDWNAWGEPHRPADPRIDPHRTSDPRQQPSDPRHDLRGGISGRLNGDMWSQHHQHAGGPNKMMPTGGAVNQWGAQGPKESIKSSGWEEPSPPAARRAAGGFDDGTSLWAQRGGGMAGMAGRGAPQGPPNPQRIPPTPTKPDAVWGAHGQRNGSWEEPHTPGWPERDVPGWPDATGPGLWPVPKPKPTGPAGGWPDDIGEWGGPKPPQNAQLGKQLPKEMVWNSKQFRYLVEMGYKKEDAEAALRSRDMNVEEAQEMLAAARGEGWRREEHFHHGGPFQPPPSVPAVSPAVVQKLLNQPPPQPPHHHPYNSNSGTGNSGQPSTAQLRMLVQQIQMAVSAGYLNHQILNQPLAPQTLVLLNQLLQQIKVLQQLVQQHTLAISKANSSLALQYSMQITKTKQQITALQNQIATQQALYMKQQAGGADLFKQSHHDPLSQLPNNFSDMSINKDSQAAYGGGGQQSRLNQWKLPSLDKDGDGSEFSRAPGTAKSATSPQLNQLGLQPDSTWGVGRGAEGWGEASADVADGKDWPAHPAHQPVYDLVPEFEPGKPWKGNQMKNVEDDPAMTPGSVVRSPLSLAVIKDSDMLGGKTSPPGSERSLSSSTWSYAPPATSAGALKPPADAWGAKPRPVPPGLNKAWPQHHGNSQQRSVPSWQASTWLLLKNLTAQIDGSTLKTLCVQHGPLQNFHLYLNQGLALARYSTREEAAKAQMALNNCVLSNTTIFAESPAESEVQMILQHLGSGGGGAWRGGGGGGGKEGWGGGAFPGLWPDQHDQRATPSSLNSFLPPDLLGGESI